MIFGLLRFVGVIWLLGFIVLALIATSSYLYSSDERSARATRWQSRLRMALIWPIALLSPSGRSRLRNG